jgi:DNA repair protein RadA/Sms
VAFGEIGLSGEVRPVAHTEARLREASKLGFTRALMPPPRGNIAAGMDCIEIARLPDIVQQLADVTDLT